MIRCSICGAELNDGVIYCPECGFEIKSSMVQVQQNSDPVMINQGVAPSINPWADQVDNRNMNYYAPQNNMQLQNEEEDSESKVGIIIGVIVVIISLAIVLVLSNNKGSSSKETTTSTEYEDYVNEISVNVENYI